MTDPTDYYVITRDQLLDALMCMEHAAGKAIILCDADSYLIPAGEVADAILRQLAGRRIKTIEGAGDSWLDDLAAAPLRAAEAKFGPMGKPQ